MTERRVVPVAYVTKWAATRGILVVKGAEEYASDDGVKYLTKGYLFVAPAHWTEDKAEAEKRWRASMEKAQKAAKAKVVRIAKELAHGPKWEET